MITISSKEVRDRRKAMFMKTFAELDGLTDDNEIFFCHMSSNYLVSNKGTIKNYMSGHVMTHNTTYQGYKYIRIIDFNGKKTNKLIHRLVMETFIPYDLRELPYLEVNHIDGNKTNNNLKNLEWVTRQENLQHAIDNNLFKPQRGEKNGRAKLSNKEAEEIKEFYKLGFSIWDIKKAYNNVHYSTIYKIATNQRKI